MRRLFIVCADPLDEANLEEKVKKRLLLPGEKRPVVLSCFGGPVCLAYSRHSVPLQRKAHTLLDDIRFAIAEREVQNLVLIGHRCAFYSKIPMRADGERMRQDLASAARFLEYYFRGMGIAALFDISTGEETLFEEISLGDAMPAL